MSTAIAHAELRQGLLAVSVLDDLDLTLDEQGLTLPGEPTVTLTWSELEQACGDFAPTGTDGRRRLSHLLRLARLLADLGSQAEPYLMERVVAMALPADHVDHLGPSWAISRIGGGTLHLGLGLIDPFATAPAGSKQLSLALPLPPALAVRSELVTRLAWTAGVRRAQQMSLLAVEQLNTPGATLRPVGGCDVLTLLIGARLRRAIAEGDGTGMRALAVPNRTRGWFDLARVDAAYVSVAYELTESTVRGLPRPVLVTKDAIVMPRRGGDLSRHAV